MRKIISHPIYRPPTPEEAKIMGIEGVNTALDFRDERILAERRDPYTHGFEPEIWRFVDDLLVDGNKVVLDLERVAKLSPDGRVPDGFVPKEILGAREVWIAGANRSGKSEFCGKRVMKTLVQTDKARTWSFHETTSISIAQQQPTFFRYLPLEVKLKMVGDSGKARAGVTLNVSYRQKTGFTDNSFVLPNGSQHWFKGYEQDVSAHEGDQLNCVWFDELRNLDLLRTIRGRMIDRGGIILVSFTAIDENYSSVCDEYERDARTILEVDAELLPFKRPKQISTSTGNGQAATTFPDKSNDEFEIVGYEKVPRIQVAGPGSNGNLKANIVRFHITDNLYFGYTGAVQRIKPNGEPLVGKELLYNEYRNATRETILARVYGILTRSSMQQFSRFNESIHIIDPEKIPSAGSNYHILDPAIGKNFVMIWIRIAPDGRWYVYREFPSYGHPNAYIPGHGDPGPWAKSGGKTADACTPGDGQKSLSFGLERYTQEILRLEAHTEKGIRAWLRGEYQDNLSPHAEHIQERYIDSRYGASPTFTREGQTTLLEKFSEFGIDFLAASGREISEGVALINDLLDYDYEVPIGEFSPTLARINSPKLHISRNCPNLIYAIRYWTGRDGNKSPLKDWIDVLRYATLAELNYIGADAYTWQGGGSGY